MDIDASKRVFPFAQPDQRLLWVYPGGTVELIECRAIHIFLTVFRASTSLSLGRQLERSPTKLAAQDALTFEAGNLGIIMSFIVAAILILVIAYNAAMRVGTVDFSSLPCP